MYFYQVTKQKQERKVKVMAALCFTGILLFFVECGQQGNFFRELAETFYQEVVTYCIPLLGYRDSSETENYIEEQILYYFFPVLEQRREALQYQTEIESAFSYEMILAMEAADENYVDEETGQVIGETDMEELTPEMPAADIEIEDGLLERVSQSNEKEADNSIEADANSLSDVEQVKQGSEGEMSDTNRVSQSSGGEVADVTGMAEDISVGVGSKSESVLSAGKAQREIAYSREKLADFDYLFQNFYRVDKTTTINSEQLNATDMLAKNMTLTHGAESPQILIYHTHSQEGYADSVEGDASTTVVGIGDYLTKLLQEQYGLNVIHHTGEYDLETRDDAYSLAGPAVEKILAENPSIEVVIDLHRDGVGADTRLVTNIDGVEMAKIMFVNGLSHTTSVGNIGYLYNPNLEDNLAFSFQTQLVTSEYYPGLSRGVYLKGYRYNLHYCPKSLLVEVGAQTNTVQEAMNAMIPLADIINKVLSGDANT